MHLCSQLWRKPQLLALLRHAKARSGAAAAHSSPCGPEIGQYSRHVSNHPAPPPIPCAYQLVFLYHSMRLLVGVPLTSSQGKLCFAAVGPDGQVGPGTTGHRAAGELAQHVAKSFAALPGNDKAHLESDKYDKDFDGFYFFASQHFLAYIHFLVVSGLFGLLFFTATARDVNVTTGVAAFSMKLPYFPRGDTLTCLLNTFARTGHSIVACPNFGAGEDL